VKDLLRKLKRQVVKTINYNKTYKNAYKSFKVPNIYGISVPPSEPWMDGLLAVLMEKEKRAFMDVGVNLGQTLLKVKSVDHERVYVGFEPNPNCVFYVDRLIQVNDFTKCTVIPAGLYVDNRFLELSISPDDIVNAGASVVKDFRPQNAPGTGAFVSLVSWETLPEEMRKIEYGIVKVDVEGAELDVVKSLEPVLDRDKPILVVEILPVYRADNRARVERQDALLGLLMGKGYRMYRVRKSPDGLYRDMERIDHIEIHADLALCDYVFCPSRD